MEKQSHSRFLPLKDLCRKYSPNRKKWGYRLQSRAQRLCMMCQGSMAAKNNTASAGPFPKASRQNRYKAASPNRLTSSWGSRRLTAWKPNSLMQGAIR